MTSPLRRGRDPGRYLVSECDVSLAELPVYAWLPRHRPVHDGVLRPDPPGNRRLEEGIGTLAYRLDNVPADARPRHDHCRQQAEQLGANDLIVPVGIDPADELAQAR